MWVFLDYCYVNHCILLTLLLHNHTSPMMWLHNPVKWGSALVPRVVEFVHSCGFVGGGGGIDEHVNLSFIQMNGINPIITPIIITITQPRSHPSIHPSDNLLSLWQLSRRRRRLGNVSPGYIFFFHCSALVGFRIGKYLKSLIGLYIQVFIRPLSAYHLTVMKTGLGTVTCCWGSKKGCCSFNRIKEDVVFSSNDFIIIIIILTLARVAALQVINYYFISKIEFVGKLQLKMISSLNTWYVPQPQL